MPSFLHTPTTFLQPPPLFSIPPPSFSKPRPLFSIPPGPPTFSNSRLFSKPRSLFSKPQRHGGARGRLYHGMGAALIASFFHRHQRLIITLCAGSSECSHGLWYCQTVATQIYKLKFVNLIQIFGHGALGYCCCLGRVRESTP